MASLRDDIPWHLRTINMIYRRVFESFDTRFDNLMYTIGGEEAEDLYQRGRIYYYLGNYEKAKEQLSGAALQSHGPAILLLSQVNIETGDIESAQTLAQQYLTEIGEIGRAHV